MQGIIWLSLCTCYCICAFHSSSHLINQCIKDMNIWCEENSGRLLWLERKSHSYLIFTLQITNTPGANRTYCKEIHFWPVSLYAFWASYHIFDEQYWMLQLEFLFTQHSIPSDLGQRLSVDSSHTTDYGKSFTTVYAHYSFFPQRSLQVAMDTNSTLAC